MVFQVQETTSCQHYFLTFCLVTCGNDLRESAQFEYISQFLSALLIFIVFNASICSTPPPSTSTFLIWLRWKCSVLKRLAKKNQQQQFSALQGFSKTWRFTSMIKEKPTSVNRSGILILLVWRMVDRKYENPTLSACTLLMVQSFSFYKIKRKNQRHIYNRNPDIRYR